MKIVYLIRHAKSSWEDPTLPDELRPILPKGVKKTKKISDYLFENNFFPDIIISSHAKRAIETANLVAKKLKYPESKINIEEKIYHNGIDGYFETIYSTPELFESIMIFGHNPTITNFANYFLKNLDDYIPTSGLIILKFDTNKWTDIANADLLDYKCIYPKQL
jgi:phosphohistidine phosphatase